MTGLRRNTLWSLGEFAAQTFIQLLVIRYIVSVLGIKQYGLWAVLLSAAQLAGLFDPGTAAGTGRFLSRTNLETDTRHIEKILATIFYVTLPLYLVIALVMYFVLLYCLPLVLQADMLQQGRDLIIYAIAAYVSQVFSAALAATLTGLHIGYRKSQICIGGIMVQAVLSVLLIRDHGLPGLAMAQIANYVFITVLVLFMLKSAISIRLRNLLIWDWQVIRSVMHFGAGLQVSSVAWGLFEASIRFVMSRFGGIAQVGYYEIAYRIASYPRILAFYLGQSLSPALVTMSGGEKDAFHLFYRRAYARLSFFALCSAVGIIIASPVTSFIMLGGYQTLFIFFSVLTAWGTFAHITAIPCELTAVAIGVLRYNIAGTLTALLSMLLFGPLLGSIYGAHGVAVAVLLSSLSAACIPIYFNNRAFALPFLPDWRRDVQLRGLFKTVS